MNVNPRTSCQGFFKRLNILPFYSQYVYSLLLLIVKKCMQICNNEIYTINTRQSINLHLPSVNMSKCRKGIYYMGTEIFNHLPWDIRLLLYDINKFKLVTKNFFLRKSFYSINEYFEWADKIKTLIMVFCVLHIIHCTSYIYFIVSCIVHFLNLYVLMYLLSTVVLLNGENNVLD
jgi:hypothetical protein